MITQDELKRLFTYHPDTGEFVRNIGRKGVAAGSIAGSNSHYGYIHISVNHKMYKAHRLAFLYMTGVWPKDEVDHLDGDRANNSWANLVAKSRKENACNCARRKDNISGVTGVGFHKMRNQWRARIKSLHIGWYETKEEAIKAREEHLLQKDFTERHGKEFSTFKNTNKVAQ